MVEEVDMGAAMTTEMTEDSNLRIIETVVTEGVEEEVVEVTTGNLF